MKVLAYSLLPLIGACHVVQPDRFTDDSRCTENVSVSSFDGTRLMADCYPGSGPTIVFIHGAFQSRVVWEQQIASLAGPYRLITYDLRGHGESDRPTSAAAFRGARIPGRDTEAVLDHFGVERAIIAGWSFGSIVASDAAVQLGADRVAGLVLVSGTIESNTERNRRHFGPLSEEVAKILGDDGPVADRQAAERFVSGSYAAGPWQPDLYERVVADNLRLSRDERGRAVLRPSHRYARELNELGVSVLLIHGDADNAFLVDSSIAAHEDLSRSELLRYEGTGHWPFLERAERFNADLTRFVDSAW